VHAGRSHFGWSAASATMDVPDPEDPMTPRTLFTWLARAEVVTWSLLLLGMALKYLTRATDLGVRVFGLAHGVVFLAYVLLALVLWVDQRWSVRQVATALGAGVLPFATLWAERWVGRRGILREQWRLRPQGDAARTAPERVVAAALARPATAVLVAAALVGGTTVALVVVGPPPVPGQGA
jgi:integral membrane protein